MLFKRWYFLFQAYIQGLKRGLVSITQVCVPITEVRGLQHSYVNVLCQYSIQMALQT